MIKEKSKITAEDIARYFLHRSMIDGDLITPLKMQKIVYYAYVWTLIKNNKKLFDDKIEAWPNGPVVVNLYHSLKKYNCRPIDIEFVGKSKDIYTILKKLPNNIKKTIDEVYDQYIIKSAFELVSLTHNEKPWIEAREGLSTNQVSHNQITDSAIKSFYTT